MLSVLPPIMIMLGLMDVWVSRESLMKYMGNNSGFLGVFLAMLIGSIAAGPMYAAFPFTAVLIKKGAKFSNIIIFMNAWCVTKISTLLFEIYSLEGIDVVGIFTHFSTSDEKDKEYSHQQFTKMMSVMDELEKRGVDIPLKHVANSGAIIDLPSTYLDAVRAGIILYGYYPSDEVNKSNLALKPALTLKATITNVKTLEKDMYISYGRTFKTSDKTVVATIPVGYADGYIRKLGENGKVIIKDQFAPIIGRICMDQFMIDVTNIPDVKIGDEVILLGEKNNLKYNADDIAEKLGTINYEVTCMLKSRLPRVYIKNKHIINVKNHI